MGWVPYSKRRRKMKVLLSSAALLCMVLLVPQQSANSEFWYGHGWDNPVGEYWGGYVEYFAMHYVDVQGNRCMEIFIQCAEEPVTCFEISSLWLSLGEKVDGPLPLGLGYNVSGFDDN
jgi:hypothetical protein